MTAVRQQVITRAQVMDLLAAFGLDPHDVRQVVIDPDRVTVVEVRRDQDGRALAAGNELSTVTTTIGIQDEP